MKRILTFAALWALILIPALAVQAQEAIDQTRPASPDGNVTISNIAGSITVTGWDKGEVSVKGTLGRGTERLEFEGEGSSTTIRVVLPKHAHNVEGSTLEIKVPKGSRVSVNAVSADVDVTGVTGSLDLQSVSGDIVSSGTSGEARAQTVSGDVKLKADGNRIKAKTVSGSIHVEGKSPESLEMGSVSGGIRYEGGLAPTGSFEASTVSGEIELALPASTAAEFRISTFSGSVDNALPATDGKSTKKTTGGEHLFVYGSVVDNVNGDAIYVAASELD